MTDDIDIQETHEWVEALHAVAAADGPQRAAFLLSHLQQQLGMAPAPANAPPTSFAGIQTPYVNTISVDKEVDYPGDKKIEKRLQALIRWNAVAMVLNAGKFAPELGGHIASYASASTLYEVGFNHFFKAPREGHPGDLIYFQGHASPGIYARSFLEGRFDEQQLKHFRQEAFHQGLSSYPHAWLMPDYWQYATVSMGLGPIQAIYQARFLKYLENRGLIEKGQRKVWCFCGDGEMDEPESLGALTLASRERLDNLIFVINCNLQRLDGPVRGNSRVIQEFEGAFRGAGWHVLKVIWGSLWDPLFAADTQGALVKRMEEVVDGDYQNYKAFGGAYTREHFFSKNETLKNLVAHLSDHEIMALNRGGHDRSKIYNAYYSAVNHRDQPTVILAKTVKGYGMGEAGEAKNITHQQKKMDIKSLKAFRDRFDIPIPDSKIEEVPFYRPDENSQELQYLHARREAHGGFIPKRMSPKQPLKIPPSSAYKAIYNGSGDRSISTTMAFVRILNILLKDKNVGQHVVPIIPDEARTFGMEGMFRQFGIYSAVGQKYEPVDSKEVMSYHEDIKGQILEEGITEAGAFCSWLAAGISYSANQQPMIPFFIYYSMFGFQRVGDLAWAAGDMRARGFLMGGTAGRTTLAGEGLQHQDGHSLILSQQIPNCRSYDPTYGYELATIIEQGLQEMMVEEQDIYYYITLMNENYQQPEMPEGVKEGIIKGMYLLHASGQPATLQLLGGGTILREVIKARDILRDSFGLHANVWSVPSFNECRREGLDALRYNQRNPSKKAKVPYVTQLLSEQQGPVIAATDYVKLYADGIREFVPARYVVCGTDGFGRSDTRSALREYFEVNAQHIVIAALKALVDEGKFTAKKLTEVIKSYGIDPALSSPTER